MKMLIKIVIISLSLFSFLDAKSLPYQVAFETTSCDGETGFASVNIESINKIQSASCLYKGKKLKKLLVDKNGSFITYTMTYDEAKAVMQDVKLYNRMRLKMMENSSTLVIEK
jgi:hypothetical protein